MRKVLHNPSYPENCAGGANLLPTPMIDVVGAGAAAAAGAAVVGWVNKPCSWDERWPR